MKITFKTKIYQNEYGVISFTRSAVLLPLISRIERAQSLMDLENHSSCDLSDNVCFVFNGVGKLYFQHFNNETEVKLLRFAFTNHDF